MNRKSPNMMSTTGRMPVIAEPRAMPVKPASEIGVSITRSEPNSSTRPFSTLNGVPASATSSPMTKTLGSRRISWASASRTASAIESWRSATACSLGINVGRDLFVVRVRRFQRELHAVGDLGPHLLLDPVQRGRVGIYGPRQAAQRIALVGPALLLVLGAVVRAIDIAHVMAVLSVREERHKRRPIPTPRALHSCLRRRVHRMHILPVNLLERNRECPRSAGDIARGGLAVVRVLVVHVVLAGVDDRQLPQ